jgi:hypothetical protein
LPSLHSHSPVTFAFNSARGVHSARCACCAGVPGAATTETVDCGGVTKTVEVTQFASCGCKECKAAAEEGEP